MRLTVGVLLLGGMGALASLSGFGVAVSLSERQERTDTVVSADHPGLTRSGGTLYLAGAQFSGIVLDTTVTGFGRSRVEYVDGRRHGVSTGWHSNGQPAWERRYRNGEEHGVRLEWWEDGSLRARYEYRDGVPEGTGREWYRSGVPAKEFNYEAGRESGAQRMWNEDGSIRANYVVKDGRRYGLMGTKGCLGIGSEEA